MASPFPVHTSTRSVSQLVHSRPSCLHVSAPSVLQSRNCSVQNAWSASTKPYKCTRRGFITSRRQLAVLRAQTAEDGFAESLKKIARQVQGALPIVGLISRLTSPGGGFGEVSYSEFSRDLSDNGTVQFRIGFTDLEAAYGKPANARWVLFVLWMARHGVGLVSARDMVNAARRLRITQDIEIEIDRFENARDAAVQKLAGMAPPELGVQAQLDMTVDLLCILNLGLVEGQPVPEKDISAIKALLTGTFPNANEEQILKAITTRPSRTYGYA